MRYRLFTLLFLLICFIVPRTNGSVLVQKASNSTGNASNPVTFTSPNTAGNLLIVSVGWLNGGTASLSDSSNNTYVSAIGPTTNGPTSQIWYAANVAGGANTITVTFSQWNNSTISVFEYSGLATSSPLDVAAAATGNSNALDTGSVTTTQANELIFASGYGNSGGTLTAGSNDAMEEYDTWQGAHLGLEDRSVTAAGAYNATYSDTNAWTWVAQIATFKTAPGAGASGPPICGLQSDGVNRFPSDWGTHQGPGKNGTYTDTLGTLPGGLGGCIVHQVTDNTTDSAGQGAWGHYYGTLSAMNAEDPNSPSRRYILLIGHGGAWEIVDLQGAVIVSQTAFDALNMNNWNVPVWDANNAYVFYYTSGNSLWKATISPGATPPVTGTLLHTFSAYGWLLQSDEADLSQDGDHIYLIGFDQPTGTPGGMHLFAFQLSTQTVSLSPYNTICTTSAPDFSDSNQPGCIHKVLLTPDNKLLIEFPDAGSGLGSEQGANIWDGSTLTRVQDGTSHLDSGYKLDGTTPVVVESNNSAVTSTFTSTQPCADQWNSLMVVLESNVTTGDSCLINAIPPWEIGYRGGPSNPWVTLSMFDQRSGKSPEWFNGDPNYVGPVLNSGRCQQDNNNQGYWCLYEDEIVLVRIDANNSNSLIYRLAYAYSRSAEWGHGDFYSIPRASESRDGKYVVFDSTMNFNATGCGNVVGCTDVFWIKVH
jgi:hypothetical protein